MPIIKSAKKKLRQDVKRTKNNKKYESDFKKAIKAVKTSTDKASLSEKLKKAYASIDKAIKKKIIHKNKGARLKSGVAKLARKTK